VRLIPAAHPGYGSTQERLILELMVLPRRPDGVIIFDGFNDAALPAIFGNRPGDPYDQGVLYADFYSPFFGFKRWVAKHSYLLRYLMHRSMAQALGENENRILESPQLLSNYVRTTAAIYFDNIGHMLERCQSASVPCAVFIQPVRDITWRSQGKKRHLDPLTVGSYDLILQQLHRMVAKKAIHDLTSVFNNPGHDEWYRDNVHFKDPGHEAVAKAMHPTVLKMLRKKPLLRTTPRTH
jgi:lysophospholipase L1-like esterase